jgi:hypothetical protein
MNQCQYELFPVRLMLNGKIDGLPVLFGDSKRKQRHHSFNSYHSEHTNLKKYATFTLGQACRAGMQLIAFMLITHTDTCKEHAVKIICGQTKNACVTSAGSSINKNNQ